MSTLLPDELTHSHWCPACNQNYDCERRTCTLPSEALCPPCAMARAGWRPSRVAAMKRADP